MSPAKLPIVTSEKVAVVFNKLFLLMSILSAVGWGRLWYIKTTQSHTPVIGAGIVGIYSLFGCVLLLVPWLIGTVYALVKARPENRKRVWTLILAPFAAIVILPVSIWLFLAQFPISDGCLVLTLGLMGVATIVSDFLYSKTLKKSKKSPQDRH